MNQSCISYFNLFPDERLSKDERDALDQAIDNMPIGTEIDVLNAIIEHRTNKNPIYDVVKGIDLTLLHIFAFAGFYKGFVRVSEVTNLYNPPNSKGRETPLRIAAQYGQLDIVKYIIKNIPKDEINLANEDGHTAIFTAARYGQQDVFQYLVHLQNDTKWVNQKMKYGTTPFRLSALQIAIMEDDEKLLSFYEPYVTDWMQGVTYKGMVLTLLQAAIQKQNYEFTRIILMNLVKHESLEKELEISPQGLTPLHILASKHLQIFDDS